MQKKSSAYKLLHSLELDCIVNKQGPQKNMLNAGVEPAIVCSFVVFFFINTSFCREIIIRTKQMPYHLANSANCWCLRVFVGVESSQLFYSRPDDHDDDDDVKS